ncbi:MAG: SLC13 family permease [Anaerolineales bacterium]
MSAQVVVLLAIVVAAILLFLSEKLRPDLIAMLVMLSLGLTGILNSRETFSGLSNPSVILIMAVFIMTGGLFRTGVSGVIGKWLVQAAGSSERRLVTLVVLAAAVLSLFMNNIASAAVIMPAVMDATRRTKISPSKVLLPMAMATQLGGMATLFTTSNIVASGVLVSLGLKGFGLFDFLTVGGLSAVAGLAYLIIFSRRLLPDREPNARQREELAHAELAQVYKLDERLFAAQVRPDSPMVWRSLAESGLRERLGASVVGIQRQNRTQFAPLASERLLPNDILLLETRPVAPEAMAGLGLVRAPIEDWGERIATGSFELVHVLVAPRTPYVGRTLKEIQFQTKYGMSVLALLQGDQVYRAAAADVRLRSGDALLLHGTKDRLKLLRSDPDWIVLSVERNESLRPRKMGLALLIMLATLVGAVIGPFPVALVFLTGALAIVLTGCLTMNEAYEAIEWRSVFLVAGMLPLGLALAKTGAAQLLGGAVIGLTGGLGPLATVAGLFLVTMALNQFIPGGSAVPVVIVPIAVAAAAGLGVDPRALALVVAVATGTSLLTPFAHPVNVLVMGPGGYAARDYLRLGWPLVVITLLVVLLTIHFFWHI